MIEKMQELLKLGMNPLSYSLKEIMDEAKKEVSILLDDEVIRLLKENIYQLCIAKKVGSEEYNVIWQYYREYENINTFSWLPSYQIFTTNEFFDSVQVEVRSKMKPIGLGETVTRDQYGVLSDAVTGGDPTTLNLINKGNPTCVGISQLCTGIDGRQVSAPIYVTERKIITGEAGFKPVEKVLVWFEQNAETGTMFSMARSKSVEFDLTSRNNIQATFDGQNWLML